MADFNTCLTLGEIDQNRDFWHAAFKGFFPDMVTWVLNENDYNEAQKRGVDCLVYRGIGEWVNIEAKTDTHEPNNYFIEYVSVDRTGAPGWVCKPLVSDYIAYGFVNHNRCDFLPCRALQNAWDRYGEAWKQKYRTHQIYNKRGDYNTLGLAVPIAIVWAAINECCQLRAGDGA